MEILHKKVLGEGIRVSLIIDEKEIGHGFLYVLNNDLHDQPFGFMEDVFIEKDFRGKGYGKKIVDELIRLAKEKGCYKLLGTSRHSREKVHQFYQNLGFNNRGLEFRMDL